MTSSSRTPVSVIVYLSEEDVYLQKLNYITKRDERMGPASAVNALNQTEHDIKR
jgi:hypothetical protein